MSPGPLIGSGDWGTPANFNGFRVSASLLQRCCSTEVNQTLHVWPSPALVHFWGLLPPYGILPGEKFTLWPVLHFPILAALLHRTRAVGVSQALWRGTGNGIKEIL